MHCVCNTLHCISIRCIILQYVALYCITLNYVASVLMFTFFTFVFHLVWKFLGTCEWIYANVCSKDYKDQRAQTIYWICQRMVLGRWSFLLFQHQINIGTNNLLSRNCVFGFFFFDTIIFNSLAVAGRWFACIDSWIAVAASHMILSPVLYLCPIYVYLFYICTFFYICILYICICFIIMLYPVLHIYPRSCVFQAAYSMGRLGSVLLAVKFTPYFMLLLNIVSLTRQLLFKLVCRFRQSFKSAS